MKRTALYDTHMALGARMVEFGGWEMPVQYSGILEEHHAVRHAAGLFDIDHMGQIEVQGPDALAYLQRLATNDIARMDVSEAAYGLLCYADGGVVDDIFTYRLTSRYFIAVNASNTDKDYAWMLRHTSGYDVTGHQPVGAIVHARLAGSRRSGHPAETDRRHARRPAQPSLPGCQCRRRTDADWAHRLHGRRWLRALLPG